MRNDADTPRGMLLHACCGPCSLEPVRVLRERGVQPDVFYSNSNIAPRDEYAHRLDTIKQWAEEEGVDLVEDEYVPAEWEECAGVPWRKGAMSREDRCRACYRIRFERAAAYAAENGYSELGTTLSVSPYQYTDVIREELERACEAVGVKAAFEDWRPYYDEATRRSREAGMYRQNYCGCALSKAEAEQERQERREARRVERERWAAEHAEEIAEEERRREARRSERAAYDAKRAKQRRILKELREKDVTKSAGEASCSNATT